MLIAPFLAAVYMQDWRYLMLVYPAIGIWQLFSLTAHAIYGSGTRHRQGQRRIMQWVVYGYIALTAIATCISYIFFFIGISCWACIGPFLYLWYFWICLEETCALAKTQHPTPKA